MVLILTGLSMSSEKLEADRVQVVSIDKGKPEQAHNANHGKPAQNNLCICLEGSKVLPLSSPAIIGYMCNLKIDEQIA